MSIYNSHLSNLLRKLGKLCNKYNELNNELTGCSRHIILAFATKANTT